MELKYINKEYTQSGNVCVTASYGIIIECFSKGVYKLSDFFREYFALHKLATNKELGLIAKKGVKYVIKYKEDKIDDYFHTYCRNNADKRGFQYIRELHEDNSFMTNQYCLITRVNAQITPIDVIEFNDLKEDLKTGGLAMVLYPISSNVLHSVVVGFDSEKLKYFTRDPNLKDITFQDNFPIKDILEYILFKPNSIILDHPVVV